MTVARTFEVFRQEYGHGLKRPLFWVQLALIGFMVFMLSTGQASIMSGDARVGGHKAWITSEFAQTQTLVMLLSILYVFFISVGAGMAVIRDDEQKVGELLHSTPLTPAEYVWGKYLAVLALFASALGIQLAWAILCNHALPHGTNADFVGPFALGNYLRPALIFALPTLVLFTGACFAIGGLSRLPVLVFAFPIGVLVIDAFFLWEWSPVWLPLWLNRVLQFVDPTGLRWLKENWLLVDRGVDFYNHAHVGLDALAIAQRVAVTLLGLACVAIFERRFAATLRGTRAKRGRGAAGATAATAAPAQTSADLAPLPALGMRSGAPGLLAGVLEVLRVELHLLVRAPGLYLFVPLILIQTLLSDYATGAFDTPLLATPGGLAAAMFNTLTLLLCMVLLFYTTESLQRERTTGFGAIYYAAPHRTVAMLAGKTLANLALALAVVLACLLGCAILIAVQGKVAFDLLPYALVWGLLLVPTFLVWTTFVSATFALTANRYATYAIGLVAMTLTGWFQFRGHMNWVFNWDLWSAVRWTDIATFEYDRVPLLLNRIEVLGLAVALGVLAVRLFERRERDATNQLLRLRPAVLLRGVAAFLPLLLIPLVAGATLGVLVGRGYEGAAAKKARLDYWRKNVKTFSNNTPTPSLTAVDLDVRFDPPHHAFAMKGAYTLVNATQQPLPQLLVSVNPNWQQLKWTLGAAACSTEARAGLVVVTPRVPLAPGDTARLGFTYDAHCPDGISKNGGHEMEFVLPSSIVLTGFSGVSFVPQLGFHPEAGVEEGKNNSDPKVWPADWWHGAKQPGIAMASHWCDVHMKLDLPADLQVNATGECVAEHVSGGRRVTEWRTDRPVRIFNLVAGRWAVKRGDGVAVFYDPRHPYNVDEMLTALTAARRWYGAWFTPYPWKTLRLSEFAGLPTYAQAPAGNITFSENIGFLSRSRPEGDAPFWIAAHESAHQWWPNLAMFAEGPGTEVLSEGMAHFSTLLLTAQVKGEPQRRAFAREIEQRYGRLRRADSERPLVQLDGELPGDGRIIYDKGGWVLWMLHRFQGEQRSFAALREYMATYRGDKTGAALEDYLAIQRRHAADTTAFDAFTQQWFFHVNVPHYLIEDAKRVREGNAWRVTATVHNVGTGRMPIDVAAVAGERDVFGAAAAHAKRWRDARTTVTLGAGQSMRIELRCAFAPERLVVDPDVTVLMLERPKAEVRLGATIGGTPRSDDGGGAVVN